MFTIYQKSVGGRATQRYFQEWENAELALHEDLDDVKAHKWLVVDTVDAFNTQKGIYTFEIKGFTPEGETFSLSLVDAFFEDLQ